MTYEFHIIGTDKNTVYGFAWTKKRDFDWTYNLKTGEIKAYKTLVPMEFYQEISNLIQINFHKIQSGELKMTPKRMEAAAELISEVQLSRLHNSKGVMK
jgi:hypothetical protein